MSSLNGLLPPWLLNLSYHWSTLRTLTSIWEDTGFQNINLTPLQILPSSWAFDSHVGNPSPKASPSFRPTSPLNLWAPTSSFWPASPILLTTDFSHFILAYLTSSLCFFLASPPLHTPVYHSRPPDITQSHPLPCHHLPPLGEQGLLPAVATMDKAQPLLLRLLCSLGRKRNILQLEVSVFVRLTNLFWSSQPASTSFPIRLIFFWRHTPALPLRFLACCLPLHAITRAQSSLLP